MFKEILYKEQIEIFWILKLFSRNFYLAWWRRWKWKDYVDIYTILYKWFDFYEIIKITQNIFNWAFNEKLLREQLCYFDDIDYTEEVEYIWEWPNDDEIKKYLTTIATKL